MVTYISPAVEQIADYTDTVRGWHREPWTDVFGGRAIVKVDVAGPQ